MLGTSVTLDVGKCTVCVGSEIVRQHGMMIAVLSLVESLQLMKSVINSFLACSVGALIYEHAKEIKSSSGI